MAKVFLAALMVSLFVLTSLSPLQSGGAPVPLGVGPRLLVVELDPPLPSDARERIEAAGAEVVCFLPPCSFLVRPINGPEALARSIDLVSISPLPVADKISPYLPGFIGNGGRTVTALFAGPAVALEEALGWMEIWPLAWSPGSVRLELLPERLEELACLNQVYWIEPAPEPILLLDRETRTLGARQPGDGAFQNDGASLWSYNSGAFEGIAGAGVNISITDSGIDGTHPAFNGRKVAWRSYGTASPWTDQATTARGHGTMCAGIAAGDGSWRPADSGGQAGKYAGMAPAAGLIGQDIFDNYAWYTIPALCKDAYSLGAYISSNSWGYGYSLGEYVQGCAEYDRYVRDAAPSTEGDQPLIVVVSAGNSGPTSITVGPPATAKNVISVGALGNDKSGPYGYVTSDSIIYYSSRGPTSDGRIKPDLCAPGVDVYTTSATYNYFKGQLGTVPDDPDSSSYFVGGGTSAACPGVAGACGLVVSFWRDKQGTTPSPALTKALLINGAQPIPGYTYPGPDQGWGRINVSRSVISKPDRNIVWVDQSARLRTGETASVMYNVSGQSEFKISLVWTDIPGTPMAEAALVNDLDLVVTDPDGNVYRGNNFVNGQSVPGGMADTKNNIEGFLLKSPRPGKYWVNLTGRSVPEGPQDYALVLSGVLKEISADPMAESAGWAPLAPLEGDAVRMSFTVRNVGRGPARNYPYTITVDGRSIQSGVLPDLAAGASTVVEAGWTAVRGDHSFAVDIDPQWLLDEIDENNNRKEAAVTVLHYGLTGSVTPERVELYPGGLASFEASVTNTGTAPDTVALAMTTDAPGWTGSLSQSSIYLQPGASGKVALTLGCPPLALAGETAALAFQAVSLGNSTYSVAAKVAAITLQVYSVSLSSTSPPAGVLPGDTAEFVLALRNDGNGADTLGLAAEGPPPDWQIDLSSSSLVLPARSENTFRAYVRPPDECLAGTSTTTQVTAYSLGGISASANLTVTVKQFFGIGLDLILPERTALPGSSLEAIYFLWNEGNGPDEVRAELAMAPGWDARLNASFLLAGYQPPTGCNLTIEIPPGELTGDYPVSFSARSFGGQTLYANFTIHVKQVFAVSAGPSPRREVLYPGEPVVLAISVTNLGNGNDSFELQPDGLSDLFTVTQIGGPVPLGPGRTAAAPVQLSTSAQIPAGERNLTFRAISRGKWTAFEYCSLTLLILPIPLSPKANVDFIPTALSPDLGGSELCGMVIMLAAVATSVAAIRGWQKRIRAFDKKQFFQNRI